jgi:hypothetical protein
MGFGPATGFEPAATDALAGPGTPSAPDEAGAPAVHGTSAAAPPASAAPAAPAAVVPSPAEAPDTNPVRLPIRQAARPQARQPARPDAADEPVYESLGAVVLRLLSESASTEELLGGVVELALARVPGCDAVSVALVRDGGAAPLVGASGDAARRVAEEQFENGRGPAATASASGRVSVVDDVTSMPPEEAWAAVAEAGGFGALMAVPFPPGSPVNGVLTVLSRSAPPWPTGTALAASSLAGYAAQALTVITRLDRP